MQLPVTNLEILVGDDCSNDGTSEIIAGIAKMYPHMVTHIRHDPRVGGSSNTKILLKRATGDFIARLDGDDYWLPDKIRLQLTYLDTHPGCAAVYTNALTIDEVGSPIGYFNDVGAARFDLAAMLRRGNFLNNSSVLFPATRKKQWLAIEEPLIDYRAHLLHARSGYLAQLKEPLTVYRVNAQGSMVSGMNDHVRELYWQAIQSVPRESISDDDLAHGLTDFLRRVMFRMLRTGEFALFSKWAPRVFAASPFGSTHTGILLLEDIMRIAGKEIVGYLRKGANGKRIRVLYRR